MARVFEFRAPESMRLGELPEQRVAEAAKRMADKALAALGEVDPIDVSAVSLSDTTGLNIWVDWTRSCSDRSDRIVGFQDPARVDLDRGTAPTPRTLQGTQGSVLRKVRLRDADPR